MPDDDKDDLQDLIKEYNATLRSFSKMNVQLRADMQLLKSEHKKEMEALTLKVTALTANNNTLQTTVTSLRSELKQSQEAFATKAREIDAVKTAVTSNKQGVQGNKTGVAGNKTGVAGNKAITTSHNLRINKNASDLKTKEEKIRAEAKICSEFLHNHKHQISQKHDRNWNVMHNVRIEKPAINPEISATCCIQ